MPPSLMPTLSVLMPNYNGEKYIAEAIESILNQTFSDFEFIIIDDKSTDKSRDIIQHYASEDKRIVAHRLKKNMWVWYVRNQLINKAQTNYIVWQDSDDVSLPPRIEKQYNYLLSHPNHGAVGWTLLLFDGTSVFAKRLYSNDDVFLKKKIFRYSPIALPWSIMKKDTIIDAWWFNDHIKVGEDLDLLFRMWMLSSFGNLSDPVIKYRTWPNGLTSTRLSSMEFTTIWLRLQYHSLWTYRMSLSDHLYNILQYLSVFLVPKKIKLRIFHLLRDNK